MNNHLYRILACIFSLALLIAVQGCRSSMQPSQSGTATDIDASQRAAMIVSAYPSWTSFATSGRVSIDNGRISSSMQMKIIRNKSITVSIRPVFGIEVGRMMITPDSVVLVDKMNKIYASEQISSLTNGMPFTIEDFQNLLLNRCFVVGEGTLSDELLSRMNISNLNDGGIRISAKQKVAGFGYAFLTDANNNVTRLEAASEADAKPYAVDYSDFKNGIAQSLSIDLTIGSIATSIAFFLDASRIKWNQDVFEPIQPRNNYRRVALIDYIKNIKM